MIKKIGDFLKEVKKKKSIGKKLKYLLYRLSKKLVNAKMLREFSLEDHYGVIYSDSLDFKDKLMQDITDQKEFDKQLKENFPERYGGYYGISFRKVKGRKPGPKSNKIVRISTVKATQEEVAELKHNYQIIVHVDGSGYHTMEKARKDLRKAISS